MALFKSPKPDISSVAAHGKTFDVVNGFIEVAEQELSSEIEKTLTGLLGFKVATDEDVDAALGAQDLGDQQKRDAEERANLLAKIKAWGQKVDGRKGLAWVRERYDEFVKQGLIKEDVEPAGTIEKVEGETGPDSKEESETDKAPGEPPTDEPPAEHPDAPQEPPSEA